MNYGGLKQMIKSLDEIERFFERNRMYFESRGLSGEVYYILKNLEVVKKKVYEDFKTFEDVLLKRIYTR